MHAMRSLEELGWTEADRDNLSVRAINVLTRNQISKSEVTPERLCHLRDAGGATVTQILNASRGAQNDHPSVRAHLRTRMRQDGRDRAKAESCESCRFFRRGPDSCHRYPPSHGSWPQTFESDWCGEWKPKPAGARPPVPQDVSALVSKTPVNDVMTLALHIVQSFQEV